MDSETWMTQVVTMENGAEREIKDKLKVALKRKEKNGSGKRKAQK